MSENFYSSFGQGTQINTSTLEVTSLNQEFVAGEDITAGDVVSIYAEYTDNATQQFTISNSSGTTNRTFTLTADSHYIEKIYTKPTTSSGHSGASYGTLTIQDNMENIYFSGSVTAANGPEYTFIINQPIVGGTIKVTLVNGPGRQFSVPLTIYSKKNTNTNNICKASNTTKTQKRTIGIAKNSGTTGETIQVRLFGVQEIEGVLPGIPYGVNTSGQLGFGNNLGYGIGTNKLLIGGGQLVCFNQTYITVSSNTTQTITINHNFGKIPTKIYQENLTNNTLYEYHPDYVDDTKIQIILVNSSTQTQSYSYKFYIFG